MKHQILQVRDLQDSVFILRLERNGLDFEPGQYISLGTPHDMEKRDYTIYSSPEEDFLELLIKDVDGGDVSGKLHRSQPGEMLDVKGPFGTFTIPLERRQGRFLFVATGTGIAPFHSFATSYRDLDYLLLHGVPESKQLYGYQSYQSDRHVACLSRSDEGGFSGRVTEFLKSFPVAADTYCYLCGNSDMIYEVFEILQKHGLPRKHIFTEVYF